MMDWEAEQEAKMIKEDGKMKLETGISKTCPIELLVSFEDGFGEIKRKILTRVVFRAANKPKWMPKWLFFCLLNLLMTIEWNHEEVEGI